MKASEGNGKRFHRVLTWIGIERRTYQTEKFDYGEELHKPIEYWEQQFDSYIQRLRVFPIDSELHTQAALKLAATCVAYAEHCAERTPMPKPGVPSGTVESWWDVRDND